MFNVRYHIASLVGVFLALALGLILGGLVVQRGTIGKQEDGLVQGLRKEFSTLRAENSDLSVENERLESFSTVMADQWVGGRLAGRTILVVTNSGRESGVSAATDAIESAGGKVVVAVLLKPGMGLDEDAIRSRISSATTADRARSSVAASLVAEWTSPNAERPLTTALATAGALRVEGLESGVAIAGLVDVAVADGDADAAGIALATAFAKVGPSAGMQTRTAGNGVAAAAHRAGVAAADTLDTPIGHYTLVALLTGAKPAYYGIADQAVALFPALSAR